VRFGVVVQSSLLALMLLSLGLSTVSAVDWTDELTDPQGDVHDTLGNIATGREDVDILSVRFTETTTDLNVTLNLAGHYNATAEYTIDLLADWTTGYSLTWKGSFAATGPSGVVITVTGHISRDGTALSWVMAKSSVAATTTLRIDDAEARLAVTGGLVYTDTVEGTPPDVDKVQLPKSIIVRIVYKQLSLRNVTIAVTYDGANASAVRALLDLDADGTVSPQEASVYATEVRERISRESRLPNSTLDSKMATRASYGFDLEGALGNVTGTAPVKLTMTQALEFPLPETKGSHVYVYESAIGGDEPWDNKALGDDPWGDACIGGDEPWDNVFFGGVAPWGAQAIGGDEPWDNVANVVFSLEAPDGWRFATKEWPTGLADHVNSEGDVLEMDSATTASSYASTMGRMNTLSLEELSDDGDGGFIPDYGAMLTLVAASMVATLLSLRRGRAHKP
jgi:hypothetical protein